MLCVHYIGSTYQCFRVLKTKYDCRLSNSIGVNYSSLTLFIKMMILSVRCLELIKIICIPHETAQKLKFETYKYNYNYFFLFIGEEENIILRNGRA